MTILRHAEAWAQSVDLALPVVWYRGQREVEARTVASDSGVMNACMRLISREPTDWTARIVKVPFGALTIYALAVSVEPFDRTILAEVMGHEG